METKKRSRWERFLCYVRLEARDVPTQQSIANRQCYDYPQGPSATLVERRDIALWGMFDDLNNAISPQNGIMHNLRAPAVAVFYAVTKDGVALDELSNIDTIAENDRVRMR